MTTELQVDIWRGGAEGAFVRYTVPRADNQTILDVVTWVQRHADASLSYRFACRVGMCGSCAMTVNGKPRWTCRTHVAKVVNNTQHLRIEPLKNLPIIKDLAADLTPFFEKWQAARGTFKGSKTRHQDFDQVAPTETARAAANAHVECINCAVCYAACDVVKWTPQYLGPAALNRAWVAYNDSRDADRQAVLRAVAEAGGCFSCHTHQSCAEHCPVALNPTAGIAGLKQAALRAYLKGDLKAPDYKPGDAAL